MVSQKLEPKASAPDEATTVVVHRHYAAPDDLLPFPFGLEREAARKVMRDGHLRAAKIGRRVYARRSDVLALVDKLATEAPPRTPKATRGDVSSDYAAIVGGRR